MLQKAIACYRAALLVYSCENMQEEWALTQSNLGRAYLHLWEREARQDLLERAIACFEAALRVYSREWTPLEWAQTTQMLGSAYAEFTDGDRQRNQQKALHYSEQALPLLITYHQNDEVRAVRARISLLRQRLTMG
jgi:tetratricopeptide (TPR) repeat protein